VLHGSAQCREVPAVGQCRSTARITSDSETVLPRSDLAQVISFCPAFVRFESQLATNSHDPGLVCFRAVSPDEFSDRISHNVLFSCRFWWSDFLPRPLQCYTEVRSIVKYFFISPRSARCLTHAVISSLFRHNSLHVHLPQQLILAVCIWKQSLLMYSAAW
jgi:hypothetical protein